MVFSGCSITYGTAVAVVTATGMDTEMGKIANLLEGADDGQTPLQKRLAQLGKYLGILALAACAIIFVVGLANGLEVMEIFMDICITCCICNSRGTSCNCYNCIVNRCTKNGAEKCTYSSSASS